MPAADEALGRLLSAAQVFGVTDAVEVLFDRFGIGPFNIVEDVAGFMGPAALYGHMAIDEREGGKETFSSIDEDELELSALKAALL